MEPTSAAQAPGGTARAMLRGLLLRCPRCAAGRMPRTFFGIGGTCSVCGLGFELGPGDFSGAIMVAQMLIGLLAIPVWLTLTLMTSLSFTATVVVTVAILLVVLVVGYRNVKGLWFGFLFGAERIQNEGAPEPPRRQT